MQKRCKLKIRRPACDLLEEAAETFRQKNLEYRDNYFRVGVMLLAMFPDGLVVETVEEWNRVAILVQKVTKLTRYSHNFKQGGHLDSARDDVVYSAMLEELTHARVD